MPASRRFPWVTVSAVVAAGAVGISAWLQVPPDGRVAEKGEGLPALGLSRLATDDTGELLAEQIAAYDPAPLFLPSAMNSSADPAMERSRLAADGPFEPFAPAFTKVNATRFPSPVPVPATAVAGLRLTERGDAPLLMARTGETGAPLTPRFAQVEAVRPGTGGVVFSLALPVSPSFKGGDWQPLELMGAVSRAGLVGSLVVVSSSGDTETDDYFRSHLRQEVRMGERLPAGFYVFRVGP